MSRITRDLGIFGATYIGIGLSQALFGKKTTRGLVDATTTKGRLVAAGVVTASFDIYFEHFFDPLG